MVGFDYPQRERGCVTRSWPGGPGGGCLGLKAVVRGSFRLEAGERQGTGGPLRRAYIKGPSRRPSQHRRLRGRRALVSPHNSTQDGSQSENLWGMWRGREGAPQTGGKGKGGFSFPKQPAQAQEGGARGCLPPTGPCGGRCGGGLHSSKVGRTERLQPWAHGHGSQMAGEGAQGRLP